MKIDQVLKITEKLTKGRIAIEKMNVSYVRFEMRVGGLVHEAGRR